MTKKTTETTKTETTKVTKVSYMSGNFVKTSPYQSRFYRVVGKVDEVYNKLPPQAKTIYDVMKKHNVIGRGKDIVEFAMEHGLKTKQDPAVLFAFYARRLEAAGLSISDG